ncbi:Aldo/keto reductase [Xylaria acuta]|nr:Aldo/keto reductase [Xylaria acuta]
MSPPSALRTLGKNGPKVSAIGFGPESLSTNAYGSYPRDEERFKIYDRALDLYGDSEEMVGKWFKRTGKLDDILIATKFGYIVDGERYWVDSSAAYSPLSKPQLCWTNLSFLNDQALDFPVG